MCLVLIGSHKWQPRKVSGVVGRLIFAAAFKRPLLAGLAEVFYHFGGHGDARTAREGAYDEVIAMVGLIPLAFTNVRARIHAGIQATDASPTGAGSCAATQLKRKQGSCNSADLTCGLCRREMADFIGRGEEIECPKLCGLRCCSLPCYLQHRGVCRLSSLQIPIFSERWSGPNAPTTLAMLQAGFDVLEPFDIQRGQRTDFFSDQGKPVWKNLDLATPDIEHHAPEYTTFSKARGHNTREGPRALRDEQHVMGFPWLRGDEAVYVRHSNRMALRSIKRCEEVHDQGGAFTLEHPYMSWMWFMKPAMTLASRQGVRMAVFSQCCFGGRAGKWTALLTNSSDIFQALHRPKCAHSATRGSGLDRRRMEMESEYPEKLALALAEAASFHMRMDLRVNRAMEAHRAAEIEKDLGKYHRIQDQDVRKAMVTRILAMEKTMVAGREGEHLQHLMRQGHYRGADIRLTVEVNESQQLVPYPAYRWVWRDVLSFRWQQEGHINVLEAQSLFAHMRRMAREPDFQHCRVLTVVDSQVLYYAIGKGRSPATRLNRILRRLMALQLAADVTVLPIWTISAWNWADRPSRRAV